MTLISEVTGQHSSFPRILFICVLAALKGACVAAPRKSCTLHSSRCNPAASDSSARVGTGRGSGILSCTHHRQQDSCSRPDCRTVCIPPSGLCPAEFSSPACEFQTHQGLPRCTVWRARFSEPGQVLSQVQVVLVPLPQVRTCASLALLCGRPAFREPGDGEGASLDLSSFAAA